MIKTHHNVGGLPKELGFDLVEPLRQLFKDEVRRLGVELGLDSRIVHRQPFPGPVEAAVGSWTIPALGKWTTPSGVG